MVFCTNCGKRIRDNSNFCTQCGTKVRKTQQSSTSTSRSYQQPQNEQRVNKTPSYKTPIVFQTKQMSSSNISSRESIPEPASEHLEVNEPLEASQESHDIVQSTNDDLQTDSNSESQTEDSSENEDPITETQLSLSEKDYSEENSVKEELKENLMRIKYSFKKLDEPEPYLFKATFFAGSIKTLTWNFQNGIILDATLPESVNEKIVFSLELKDDRPQYDWKNPYNNVIFFNEFDDEMIIKKIKREGRVIEKLSRIKGAIKAKVSGSNIIVNIESIDPSNIRPALDAIKEIAWLMDITLK